MRKQFTPRKVVAHPQGAFSRSDAAAYLSVSTRFLDQLVSDGKLQRCRLSAKPLFRRCDLDALLARSIEREDGKNGK